MRTGWTHNKVDAEVLAEVQETIPDQVFDIHAHLYRVADIEEPSDFFQAGPAEVTVEVWREHMARHMGTSQLVGALFLPLASRTADGSAIERVNRFLAAQLSEASA